MTGASVTWDVRWYRAAALPALAARHSVTAHGPVVCARPEVMTAHDESFILIR